MRKTLYCGMDLHSSNTVIGLVNKQLKKVWRRRVKNDKELILAKLKPHHDKIEVIGVEATYNMYWLVDALMEAGYRVRLGNPAKMKQYSGLKYSDDNSSALWIAHMLALGILPEGYIYPKEERPARELMRRRYFLVKHRTSHILSLQSLIHRYSNIRLTAQEIKNLQASNTPDLFDHSYTALLAANEVAIIEQYTYKIKLIEKEARKMVKLRKEFHILKTMPGIGEILALFIMLEVGDIKRFRTVGKFCSYCRCAPSNYTSNDKKKGRGNTKNGNKYLSWALIEAVQHGQRNSFRYEKYYRRKLAQTNKTVAMKATGNKVARAIYYMLRDQVPFKDLEVHCS